MDTNKRCKSCGGTVRIEFVKDAAGSTTSVGTCEQCGRRYDEGQLLSLTGHSNPAS